MLDAGSSLCKPLGEIAVDEIWIKLHLTKVSLVQSVNYLIQTGVFLFLVIICVPPIIIASQVLT